MSQQAENAVEEPRRPRDTLAARLVLMRHELDLTVDEISARCGVPSASWSNWEHGTQPRDLGALVKKIAEGTEYDRDWIMWGGLLLSTQFAPDLAELPAGFMVQPQLVDQDGRAFIRPPLVSVVGEYA